MKLKHFILALVAMLSGFAFTANAANGNVAKVGNTEYATIDEAIANWGTGEGNTLTLLSNVTLSDVIKLKSTEHHYLNLSTYTMTACSDKNAIEIVAYGNGSAEQGALTITADAATPGGINAGRKSCIYYNYSEGETSGDDRPIIYIKGGVFTGSTTTVIEQNYLGVIGQSGIFTRGKESRKAATLNISGGTFNCTVYGAVKSKLIVSGGVFNYSVGSKGDSTANRTISGGKFKGGFSFMTYGDGKLTFGNVGVYVDKAGYLCFGGNPITELSSKYQAVNKNVKINDYSFIDGFSRVCYLEYTTAKANGLYYEDASMAPAGSEIWTKPAVTIPEDVTGDATVVEEIKNNTALEDYTPENLPAGAELEIVLESAGETFVYEVAPMANGTKVEPTEAITFRLPVPASVTETYAKVYHEGTLMGIYAIQGEDNAKYVEVSSADFSLYTVEPTTVAAKIGETGYATFAEALAAAKAMTGDVTVEIYEKVILNGALTGNYASIKFVGKDTDAEIYLDIQGYSEAAGKKVAFENLKLSKVAGGYITNAGFMNLAFGIYGATETTYTNCTFLNGAYASTGDVTFTGCTFKPSHDRYAFWAYGDVNITINGCTFDAARGIKMYDEAQSGLAAVTVKGSDFSALTQKPAIVLTYGESVELEGNIYSPTGVFELDLDGNPNGTLVTSNDELTCVNDNGACGVLVDGKIYTTVAQAKEVATSGSNVTLLHNSAETVEFAQGVNLDKNGFAAEGVTIAKPVAKIGDTEYATLSAAFAAVTDDNQTVVICKDVTEELTTAYLRGNITTENDAKVTITLTNSGQNYYIYCPYTFILGKNVTLKVPNGCLFYYAGGSVINGTLITNGYYQRYAGTKLTINEPGSMTVTSETCIIRYMDGDANAGIYVVGDDNDETVELTAPVVYFYQGMINAKDANIQVGTYWQTNETDGQGSANLVLDNSTLTVTVYDHPAKATGNSTVTLTNGSVIDAKNGGFTYDEAKATLSVDKTSKIIGKNDVLVELPVAKIGTTKYTSLQAAVDAAAEGDVIVLVADVEGTVMPTADAIGNPANSFIVVAAGKVVTLDLNGKTISVTGDPEAKYDAIGIRNYGDLTIVDNSENKSGKLTYQFHGEKESGTSQIHSTILNFGTLTVNGGTLENNSTKGYAKYTINNYSWGGNANVTINGGCMRNANTVAVYADGYSDSGANSCNVTVTGGTVEGGLWYNGRTATEGKNIVISGGTFVEGTNAALTIKSGVNTAVVSGGTFQGAVSIAEGIKAITGGTFSSDVTALCAEGFVTKANADGTYTVSVAPVAKIGDVEYATLIAAVNAVQEGETITLLRNETFTAENRTHNTGTWYDGLYYQGDKSFTIDLGGFTIGQDGSVNDYLLNFKNVGSKANAITLKNGTVDAGTAAYCALCTSSVQENQLTINTEDINFINNISNGSTIKLRGGAILNVKAGTVITGKNSYLGIECSASIVNIYDDAEIYMNGTSSYNGCLVGVGAGGTVNVYGGYGKGVKGGFIAMTSGGTINIAGGEWIANTDGTVGNNSNLYVLTAQSNKYESGFVGASIINVTGGTLRGGMDAWVLNNIEGEKAELNITGGNFNANPTRFVEEGYVAAENNGIYTVAKATAKVGDVYYTSLEAAFKAATSGCTIEILSDVTVSDAWDCRYTGSRFTVPVTINGNGKTIKFTGAIDDKNWNTVFRFEADATVNNLTVDISEATSVQRVISAKKSLAVDGLTIIGAAKYGVIFGEGASAEDLAAAEIVVKNSTLTGTRRAVSDNEGGKDVKSVTIVDNAFNANVYVSAKENITFTGNTVEGAYVDLRSYTANNLLNVTATGNTLTENGNVESQMNKINAGGTINAQNEFVVPAKGSVTPAFAGATSIWGEGGGNAKQSLVVKLYSGETLLATASLNNIGGIIDGDVYVSWNIPLNAAGNDEYWNVVWSNSVTAETMPTKVVMVIDGVEVAENNFQLNSPDDLNKIYAAVAAADGKFTQFCTTLAAAVNAAQASETVVILKDVEVASGSTITLDGVNVATLDGVTLTNNGAFQVRGEVSLNIATLAGSSIDFLDGAIIKNSTIGGNVFVAGNVTFRGANTFAMLYDYGTLTDYYGTTAPMKWTVEEGASVTLTTAARYGLGYGDDVTVYGNIENALTARETLTDADRSLFMHGLVAQESKGWNCDSKFTVENAYVAIGSNNSFGNKSGNYGGTYTFNIKNSVVDASRITFYEALSTTTFTIDGSDVKMGTFMTRDADSKFVLKNSKVLSTTTSNGTDEGNYNKGELTLVNSSLTYSAEFKHEAGVINLNLNSLLTAPKLSGAGKIYVDATGITTPVTVIKADMSDFTGTITVEGGSFEIINEDLVIKEKTLAGAGTEENPYLINNVEELVFFRDKVNSGDTKYNAPGVWVALAADIDLAGTTWTEGIGDGHNWSFDGNFDGKNHTIKNLTVAPYADGNKYLCGGLFGYIYGGATIKDLVIENATVEFAGEEGKEYFNVGVLVGFANNNGGKANISGITVKGDIKVDAPNAYGVGAIVGYSYREMGTIANCKVEANAGSYIKGHSFVGGITGYSYTGAAIADCSVKNIAITATKYSVGGIAGITGANTTVSNCYVDVENVTVNGEANVGNVVGAISADALVVENCTAAEPLVGGNYSDNKPVEARIGNKYYATLTAALVAEGNEVELLVPVTVAKDETRVIDLNGKTVTGVDNATASFALITNKGDLTITGNGKITLTATENRGWNAYSSVISNSCGTLVVENGTIEHRGGTDMAYAIDNLSGSGDAECTINGGTIKSTYRAIRQFLNSTANDNILTVNGGTIEGANKSIWFQDPSTKANKGTLTVTEDATLNGDVYLSVTAGSTEWPVEVAIADAAFAEGKTVVTGNVPANYEVVLYEGVHSVECTVIDKLLIVDDGKLEKFENRSNKTVGKLTYERDMSAYVGKWQPLYVPFEIPVEELTVLGYQVAIFYDVHFELAGDGTIDTSSAPDLHILKITSGTLKANYPYVIKPSSDYPQLSIELTNAKLYSTAKSEMNSVESGSTITRFIFAGTYTKATPAALTGDANIHCYGINKKGNFQKMGSGATLPAFRVYMSIVAKDGSHVILADNVAESIRMRAIGEEAEDGTTIIYDVEMDNEQTVDYIYDLQGRRVLEPQKGNLYIINGKKVIF